MDLGAGSQGSGRDGAPVDVGASLGDGEPPVAGSFLVGLDADVVARHLGHAAVSDDMLSLRLHVSGGLRSAARARALRPRGQTRRFTIPTAQPIE